jgi:hypothetical protein
MHENILDFFKKTYAMQLNLILNIFSIGVIFFKKIR